LNPNYAEKSRLNFEKINKLQNQEKQININNLKRNGKVLKIIKCKN
jgi:hypothetical protein